MNSNIGNNLSRVKVSNQAAIKRIVYLYGPITRLEVANRLGLTLPTITTNVSSMIKSGLIEECQAEPSVKALGRRSSMINIRSDANYFIGLDIFRKRRLACISDYRGNIVETAIDANNTIDYDELITSAGNVVRQLLDKGYPIAGIGICMSGTVDSTHQVLQSHFKYNWKNRPVCDDIRRVTGFEGPITLENDAASRAFGACLFDRTILTAYKKYSYLFVSDGISCPLMVNEENYISSPVGPGEIGYMRMPVSGNPYETDLISNLCGERGIKEKAIRLMEEGRAPALEAPYRAEGKLYMKDLLASQEAGDAAIDELLKSASAYLGIIMANIHNFVKPECMLIEAKLFLSEANKAVFGEYYRASALRFDQEEIDMVYVTPDTINGARGGAAIAVQNDLGRYVEAPDGR